MAAAPGTAVPSSNIERASRVRAAGVSLPVDAAEVPASKALRERLADEVLAIGAAGSPLGLRVHGLAAAGKQGLAELCALVAAACRRAAIDPGRIEVTVRADSVAPADAWRTVRRKLGAGRLNIVCDDASLRSTRFFDDLWQHRGSRRIVTAFWPEVRSRCALLGHELADDVVPGVGIQAPCRSAWLHARVDLRAFVDGKHVDWPALRATLNAIVERGERQFDSLRWPTPTLQHDAWLNRRLAVEPTHIGDVATAIDPRPCSLEALRWCDRLLEQIRGHLDGRTRELAQHAELLPAIEATNPLKCLGPGGQTAEWERRWLNTVASVAVRNRNLLVISPWSLFPVSGPDIAYKNLLPLLDRADACVFRSPPNLSGWSVMDFKHLHRRTWALLRKSRDAELIADHI